jgi:hypothetical protein
MTLLLSFVLKKDDLKKGKEVIRKMQNIKKMSVLLVSISVLMALVSFNIRASQTSSTRIYVSPSAISTVYNTNFTVDINIENVIDLFWWQVKLKWDPGLLTFVNVTGTEFQPLQDFILNETGGWIFLHYENLSSSTALQTVSGSGTLAKITFNGTGVGECILDIDDNETKIFSSHPTLVSTPPYLGDANNDSIVNVLDLGGVGRALGRHFGDPRWDPNADFNNDSFIDLFDLLCVFFNFAHMYPGNASEPVEIVHSVDDGNVIIIYGPAPWNAAWTVTWNWLNNSNPVWYEVNVTITAASSVENFDFNRSSGEISFTITSTAPGYCNVSIPKLLMDGAFNALLNDTETPCILTWNKTHTFVYFTYPQGTHNTAIVGEIVTRIRSLDLSSIVDVNGDRKVNIVDITKVAIMIYWNEDH